MPKGRYPLCAPLLGVKGLGHMSNGGGIALDA